MIHLTVVQEDRFTRVMQELSRLSLHLDEVKADADATTAAAGELLFVCS
jgi:hypothetical protein